MEERPYRSLNEYYRSIFGRKAAKISLAWRLYLPQSGWHLRHKGLSVLQCRRQWGFCGKCRAFHHRADCKRQGADGRQMEKPCLYRLFPSLHEYLCPRGEAAAEIRGGPRLPRNRRHFHCHQSRLPACGCPFPSGGAK